MDTIITLDSSKITLHDHVELGRENTFKTNGTFKGAYKIHGPSLKFHDKLTGKASRTTYYAPCDSEIAKLNRKGNWEPPEHCTTPGGGWDSYEVLGYLHEAPAEPHRCFFWSPKTKSWRPSSPSIATGYYHIRPKLDDRVLDIQGRIVEAQRQLDQAQAELSKLQKGK